MTLREREPLPSFFMPAIPYPAKQKKTKNATIILISHYVDAHQSTQYVTMPWDRKGERLTLCAISRMATRNNNTNGYGGDRAGLLPSRAEEKAQDKYAAVCWSPVYFHPLQQTSTQRNTLQRFPPPERERERESHQAHTHTHTNATQHMTILSIVARC